MLNEVHVEGTVIQNIEHAGTRLVRVAIAPDPGRGNDAAYVTLRVEPPLAAVAATLKPGSRVRASGYITHRDYQLFLARFAETAETADEDAGDLEKLRELARSAGKRIYKPHTLTEVKVERLFV